MTNMRQGGGTPAFLIVRHPVYQTHFLDIVLHWVHANVPELIPDFQFHMLGDDLPLRDDFRLCVPWLQDPVQHWCQQSYDQAIRLCDWCDRRQIPVINRPEHLTNAGKTRAAELIARLGIRTPKTARIHNSDQLQQAELGVPFPLFVREDWGHGGPMILAQSAAELRSIDLAAYRRPAAVEWIDASRDGLYRKYRFVIAGRHGICHHLQISADWITRGGNRIKNAATRAEELAYINAPDPNYDILRQVPAAVSLDMLAIDYGYDQTGRLVIWEINPFPYIHFSTRDLRYRNAAIHETLRAIVGMYYERAQLPVPEVLNQPRKLRVPRKAGRWRNPWHRLREAVGRHRRTIHRVFSRTTTPSRHN